MLTGIVAGSAGGDAGDWLDRQPRQPTIAVVRGPSGKADLALAGARTGQSWPPVPRCSPVGIGSCLAMAAVPVGVFLLAATFFCSNTTSPLQAGRARLDGHAGNFALLALLTSGASRLRSLHTRWRIPASILILALIVWPTVALPVRTLGFEISHGIALTNATPGSNGRDPRMYTAGIGRQPIERLTPDQVTRFIPDPPPPLTHTPHRCPCG